MVSPIVRLHGWADVLAGAPATWDTTLFVQLDRGDIVVCDNFAVKGKRLTVRIASLSPTSPRARVLVSIGIDGVNNVFVRSKVTLISGWNPEGQDNLIVPIARIRRIAECRRLRDFPVNIFLQEEPTN
jgi:hypothetical protein